MSPKDAVDEQAEQAELAVAADLPPDDFLKRSMILLADWSAAADSTTRPDRIRSRQRNFFIEPS